MIGRCLFEPHGSPVHLLFTVFCIPAHLRHCPKSRVLLIHAHLLYIVRDGFTHDFLNISPLSREKVVPPPRVRISLSPAIHTLTLTIFLGLLVQFISQGGMSDWGNFFTSKIKWYSVCVCVCVYSPLAAIGYQVSASENLFTSDVSFLHLLDIPSAYFRILKIDATLCMIPPHHSCQ